MLMEKQFPTSGNNPQSLTVAALARKITSAKKKYIRWLNRNHPKILRRALDEAGLSRSDVGLSGLSQAGNPAGPGSTSTTSNGEDKAWYDRLLDYVPNAVQAYGAYEQQKALIELNEERAKQGQPPLNNMPAIRVEGEAGPETRQAMQAGIQNALGQYTPYILAGLGIWFITSQNKGRKRR